MADRPEPPPWGALIATALKRAGMSAREAARRAGISEGRWRQIAGGYEVISPGVYAEVRGPAATLAKMAAVAGVTGAELGEAGREDAAQALAAQELAAHELARQQQRLPGEEILERLRSLDADQARALLTTIAVQLGISQPSSADDDDARRYGT
jgi:transcriptional regulator with XRE-family HTH domain